MLKILIVEDEPLLRMAVKDLIDWEDNGYRIIGEAHNGEDAIRYLEKELPDIMLTDIKMPVMNGVDLLKLVKDRFPYVRTIVLSNYDDFDYVKQAMKYGAVDYILKPNINAEMLLNIVNNTKVEIEKHGIVNKTDNFNERELEKNFEWIRNEYLKNLVKGKVVSLHEIQTNNSYYHVNLSDGAYIVCDIKLDRTVDIVEKYGEDDLGVVQNVVLNTLKELFPFEGLYFTMDFNEYVIIVYMEGHSENTFFKDVYEFSRRLQTIIMRCINITLTIGLSEVFSKLTDIKYAYRHSVKATEYKFYLGKSKIFKKGDMVFKEEELLSKWLDNNSIKLLRELVIRQDEAGVIEFIDDLISDIVNEKYFQKNVKVFIINLIFMLKGFFIEECESLDSAIFIKEETIFNINSYETFEEIIFYLKKYISRAFECIREKKPYGCSKLVSDAIRFIHENFDSDVSLTTVSDYVKANASYLSRLVLQETGKNFIEILTEYRVKKAMKYLKETDMSLEQICLRTGYTNTKYFSRLFKKVVGRSPQQYRKECKK